MGNEILELSGATVAGANERLWWTIMKYMGSKRYMLSNGLGKLLLREAESANRVVDLFCGTGSVARHVCEHTDIPALGIDLQAYSVVLTHAIISRDEAVDVDSLNKDWLKRVKEVRKNSLRWEEAKDFNDKIDKTTSISYHVNRCRKLCEGYSLIGPIWNAYGGYYFSPQQALTFDYLLKYLPKEEPKRTVCLASVIIAASRCAASPGHTAQPFKPNETAGKFLIESWKKDPIVICERALKEISEQYARTPGEARVGDAVAVAKNLNADDLVFVDPPYSGVQYSRFYHVLETIAKGECGPVSGEGRYPDLSERPQSKFSNKGQSKEALEELLTNLAQSQATVIFTFPKEECSNGLSGDVIREIAELKGFNIDEVIVKGRFSTLGGNNMKRDARKDSNELILLMRPSK